MQSMPITNIEQNQQAQPQPTYIVLGNLGFIEQQLTRSLILIK